jgi:hypothetical protein
VGGNPDESVSSLWEHLGTGKHPLSLSNNWTHFVMSVTQLQLGLIIIDTLDECKDKEPASRLLSEKNLIYTAQMYTSIG